MPLCLSSYEKTLVEISDDIIIDSDKDNNVIGIEILSASQKADIIQTYDKVTVENSV